MLWLFYFAIFWNIPSQSFLRISNSPSQAVSLLMLSLYNDLTEFHRMWEWCRTSYSMHQPEETPTCAPETKKASDDKKWTVLTWTLLPARFFFALPNLYDIKGSFRNNDGDGYENVTYKVNSRCLKRNRAYSNSFDMSYAGECFWSWRY